MSGKIQQLLGGETDDWNSQISKVSTRVHELKKEISGYVVETCKDFMPLMTSMEDVDEKMNEIKGDTDQLFQSFKMIEDQKLAESCQEFERMSTKHGKVLELVKALNKLYKIHLFLQSNAASLESKKYMEALNDLQEIDNILDSITEEAFLETKILSAIRTELKIRKQVLMFEIAKSWDELITWNDTEIGFGEIRIKEFEESSAFSLENLVYSMFQTGIMSNKIKLLAEQCFERLLQHVITKPSHYDVIISTNTLEGAAVCSLKSLEAKIMFRAIDSEEQAEDWESKIEVMKIALDKFMQILTFLNDHILHVNTVNCECHLMREFGKVIRDRVIKLLIDSCLEESVPNTKEELSRYEKVVELIKTFETSLVKIGFLKVESGSLMDYVMNIHSHFAIRRTTLILKQARNIVDKDMLNIIEVEDETKNEINENIRELLCDFSDANSEGRIPETENITELPRFKISLNIKELVGLIESTLEESRNSNLECAERLSETTCHIVEIFLTKSSSLEEEFGMIPQSAAVFHNNCWYISHHLYQFATRYTRYFDEEGFKLNLSFSDQIVTLRQLSMKWFISQMTLQRTALYESIEPLRTVVQDAEAEKYPTAEKCIKQILMQILKLRKVWVGVLPNESLLKSLIVLTDAAVANFIESIICVDDVVSSASDQLQMACALLQEKLPYLFIIPGVDKDKLAWRGQLTQWNRLEELKLLLGASLSDIVDRWCDGVGPLALAFTVTEVRHLIMALYQNTDYRANAISKIRKAATS